MDTTTFHARRVLVESRIPEVKGSCMLEVDPQRGLCSLKASARKLLVWNNGRSVPLSLCVSVPLSLLGFHLSRRWSVKTAACEDGGVLCVACLFILPDLQKADH